MEGALGQGDRATSSAEGIEGSLDLDLIRDTITDVICPGFGSFGAVARSNDQGAAGLHATADRDAHQKEHQHPPAYDTAFFVSLYFTA